MIAWDVLDALCKVRCTLAEIAAHFMCSEDTIERAVKRQHHMGFADYYRQKEGAGTVALRRKQFQVAMKGNVTMLIWLGKQHLGQTDRTAIETRDLTLEDMARDGDLIRQRLKQKLDRLASP